MASIQCIRTNADPVQIAECRKKVEVGKSAFTRLASILSLAGSEVRLKILYLLKEENELCPCDIADILNMTVPAVSQHLRKLKDSSIIKHRKSGNTIYYSLGSENLKVLRPFFKYINKATPKQEVI